MSHTKIRSPKYGNVGNSNPQNLFKHIVSSHMHFDNTKPFVDHVGAVVNDVMITNEVNASGQPMAQG